MTKEDITREVRNRAEILEWMNKKDVRTFREVAKIFSRYIENPKEFIEKIRSSDNDIPEKDSLDSKDIADTPKNESDEKTAINIDEKQKINKKEYDDFNNLKSIDEETADILRNNGILTIKDLKDTSLKDLIKIKGINKKTVKTIKEEIDKQPKDNSKSLKTRIKKDFGFKLNKNKKINLFKDVKSINEKIAGLLYDNGIRSVEKLYKLTLDDLLKIKGINRKTATKIIEELYNNILIKGSPIDTNKGDEMDATK